jgi:hypothetical protein
MGTKVEDLLLTAVTEVFEQVLEGYPDYPYKKAFTNPDLRRTLIAQVLSQLQNWHPGNEEGNNLSNTPEDWQLSQEDKMHIQTIIRQEIAYIIQQKSECISRTATEEIDSCFTPSHWFG